MPGIRVKPENFEHVAKTLIKRRNWKRSPHYCGHGTFVAPTAVPRGSAPLCENCRALEAMRAVQQANARANDPAANPFHARALGDGLIEITAKPEEPRAIDIEQPKPKKPKLKLVENTRPTKRKAKKP